MSDSNVKLSPQDVDEAVSKIGKVINTSESDLSGFENIILLLLTPENVSTSKKLAKLADTNDMLKTDRKRSIDAAVTNLKLAKNKLTEYKEAFGI